MTRLVSLPAAGNGVTCPTRTFKSTQKSRLPRFAGPKPSQRPLIPCSSNRKWRGDHTALIAPALSGDQSMRSQAGPASHPWLRVRADEHIHSNGVKLGDDGTKDESCDQSQARAAAVACTYCNSVSFMCTRAESTWRGGRRGGQQRSLDHPAQGTFNRTGPEQTRGVASCYPDVRFAGSRTATPPPTLEAQPGCIP